MNVVQLQGGLANQMFQYAFGQALGEDTLYDVSWFERAKSERTTSRPFCLDVFNIPATVFVNRRPPLLARLVGKYKVVRERNWDEFQPEFLNLGGRGTNYFKGYFQNERYLNCVKDKISADFSLKNTMNSDNLELLKQIRNCNSVSLHIRRGDYVKQPDYHPLCGIEYYQAAMKMIEGHYFLFSDDIEWCKANAKTDMPMTIVDINSAETGYWDMELMKNCKHNIIANSSFSWMAAYLNPNPDKMVIAPKDWNKHNGEAISNRGLSEKYIQIK
ncbi:alpha-1,2-fucosyltransferase [Candidatus Symbiothrix dinenymphae]|nr:alpha-1,2-fucosyltransferase [Candidatus Symbiothrix dinenymphae]